MPKVGLLESHSIFVRVFGAAQAADNMIFEVLVFVYFYGEDSVEYFCRPFFEKKLEQRNKRQAVWCSPFCFIYFFWAWKNGLAFIIFVSCT